MGDTVVKEVEAGGVRLDVWLTSFPQMSSRSFAQKLIQEGRVKVNGAPPAKAGQKLRIGDLVEVSLPPPVPAEPEPEAIPLESSTKMSTFSWSTSLRAWWSIRRPGHFGHVGQRLAASLPGPAGDRRRQTAGDRSPARQRDIGSPRRRQDRGGPDRLARALKERRVERNYLALGGRRRPVDQGRSTLPSPGTLSKGSKWRWSRADVPRGPTLRSRALSGATYLKARLETGRTHQIRVHMAFIGHPSWATSGTARRGSWKDRKDTPCTLPSSPLSTRVTGRNLKFDGAASCGICRVRYRRLRKGR